MPPPSLTNRTFDAVLRALPPDSNRGGGKVLLRQRRTVAQALLVVPTVTVILIYRPLGVVSITLVVTVFRILRPSAWIGAAHEKRRTVQ